MLINCRCTPLSFGETRKSLLHCDPSSPGNGFSACWWFTHCEGEDSFFLKAMGTKSQRGGSCSHNPDSPSIKEFSGSGIFPEWGRTRLAELISTLVLLSPGHKKPHLRSISCGFTEWDSRVSPWPGPYRAPVTTSGSATDVHMAKAGALSASCDSNSFVVVIFLGPWWFTVQGKDDTGSEGVNGES